MPDVTPPGDSPYRPMHLLRKNILETTESIGRFETLGKALRSAGLAELLEGDGPFTLFAPTDVAFAKMPKAALATLFADKVALARLVRSHLVRDNVKAPRAGTGISATTEQGTEVKILSEDGRFRVNDARVVKTDIRASNGVIHAIDTVLTAS
jgi:uncharacterized surface protein with fasciclin (FAS1) repeats